MTVGQVAERLGVGKVRVRQLDAELAPARCTCGSRIYDPAAVAALVAKRAAAAAELSQARRERMLRLREGRP